MSANQELTANILVKDDATGEVLAEQSGVKIGTELQTVSLTVEALAATVEKRNISD